MLLDAEADSDSLDLVNTMYEERFPIIYEVSPSFPKHYNRNEFQWHVCTADECTTLKSINPMVCKFPEDSDLHLGNRHRAVSRRLRQIPRGRFSGWKNIYSNIGNDDGILHFGGTEESSSGAYMISTILPVR